MADIPKKKKSTAKSKTTTKKKPSTKKSTAKPRKYQSRKKSNTKKNILIVLAVFMMITFVVFGYFLGKNSDTIALAIERGEIEGDYTTKRLLEDLSKITIQDKTEKIQKIKKVVEVKEKVKVKPKVIKHVKASNPKVIAVKKTKVKKITLAPKSDKPKLAIVIDDVSKQSQMNSIVKTGVKMTPSIFPPSELSMTSHHLAKGLKHYMIHLPMESGSKQFNTQYKTLLTSFSKNKIEKRVRELRMLFPNARYVNNHTGSVYTNDYHAMNTLYAALKKEGFVFIDSRTVGSSKVKRIAKEFGDVYVSRDIFIDNKHTVKYIHKQLRKAVKIAKKKGFAVAIGHPHKVTMQALSTAESILSGVELVYMDTLLVP